MDLVIDANILFAALIKKGITSELLFKENFHLYASEFIFIEFSRYKPLLRNKTERTDEDFEEVLELFERRVTLVPNEEIIHFLDKAKGISPDIKDVPYVALALKLNCAIWSNDKALKEKQHIVKVYSTEDLIRLED
ncbi:PIN domain-containing protein [Candidatus Woesearchaeota archaeon]|nr:PIN domain-containing protein [Candidatus Woesearchaeota archaeon]